MKAITCYYIPFKTLIKGGTDCEASPSFPMIGVFGGKNPENSEKIKQTDIMISAKIYTTPQLILKLAMKY
jgi:hypothetical protein